MGNLLERLKVSRWIYLISLLLITLVALGVTTLNVVLTEGHGVTGISDDGTMPYGLWMSLYIYFVGLSAGSVIISGGTHVFGLERYKKITKIALLQAVALLAVAMFFIFFDVGRPERAIEFFQTPNLRSPLAWIVWLYSAYFLLCISYLFFGEILGKPKLSKAFGFIAIPLAVSVHGGLGVVFAVLKARPFWNTSLLPVLFLTSALMSGVALLIVILAVISKVAHIEEYEHVIPDLGRMLLFFIAFELFFLFLFSEAIVVTYENVPGAIEGLMALLAGPLAFHFLGIQIFLGAIVPIAILAHPNLKKSVPAIVFASVLVVAGAMAIRYNFLIAGMIPPLLPGLPYGTYIPTLTEWLVALGWFALAMLIMLWGAIILPIIPERRKKQFRRMIP